jgi:hypothetical protein
MSEEPKSSYEIAMEKLKARDRERGAVPPRRLSAKQRDQIAEVRTFYASKLAEREILFADELKKAGFDADKRAEVEKAYAEDRRRMEAEMEERIRKIRE